MTKRLLLAGAVCALVSGCESSGLSVREGAGNNYARYVYSFYDAPAPTTAPVKLTLPAGVAVAQVGEVAPPPKMLETLRNSGGIFTRVESIPGGNDTQSYSYGDYNRSRQDASQIHAREQMERMAQFAQDMGVKYLLVFGGTIDQQIQRTPLSALDWTIVGMYVVPSQQIGTRAMASAALIDVHSRRVVLTASAAAEASHASPVVSLNDDRVLHRDEMRNQAIEKLAKAVVEQCRTRGGV